MADETPIERKVPDLADEMLAVEGIESDEELLLARDLTSALVKTIKAFRFYPQDNPTLKGFRDQLFKKSQFFLNRYQMFIMHIGEYSLSCKGKVIYENRDVKSSLAYLFYRDGLRELRFTKGLEEWEIQGLIDLIRACETINQMEDDLVTLIWEKDFAHISYLATDEFLEETPVVVPDHVEQFRRNLVLKPVVPHIEMDMLDEEPGEGTNIEALLGETAEIPPAFGSNRGVYLLTSREAEGLRKEVEDEIDPAFVLNILDLLFEILAMEKDPEPYQDTLHTIGKILDAFLTLGDFGKAADLLNRLHIILKTYALQDWQVEMLRKWINEAGDGKRIERIGKQMDEEAGLRLDDAQRYLLLLSRDSIVPLIELLGRLKNSKSRRMICDVLPEIGKNAMELFIPFMEDQRWFLVRNIIYILGRIGKEQAFPYLQKAFHHGEVRVRREALQAIGLIGGGKATPLLIRALTDADLRIRCMAALNLGKMGKASGLIPLLEIVQSKEFQKNDPMEMKAFFDAIGMIGSNEALPILRQLLEKKGWFGRGRIDDLRIGAARAIALIGTPEAKAVLEAGKQSRDETIRDACLQALRR